MMFMLPVMPVMQLNFEREALELRKDVVFLLLVPDQLAMENLGLVLSNLYSLISW